MPDNGPYDDRADLDSGQMDEGESPFIQLGEYVGPGDDDPTQRTGDGVDTPDPFSDAGEDQQAYEPGTGGPVDTGIMFRPPWPITRAPGTVPTIAPGRIIPIDPWLPTIALLNARQLAMMNRLSAARQAAKMWAREDPHTA